LNLLRIYNEKQVDEIMLIQINTYHHLAPDFDYIKKLAMRSSSPLLIGGGISELSHIEQLIFSGAERVLIGRKAFDNISFLQNAVKNFGSSSITVAVDYYSSTGKCLHESSISAADAAKKMQDAGAGEIILSSIDRNGMRCGYDSELADKIASSLSVPVIIKGGAPNKHALNDVLKKTAVFAASASTCLFLREPLQSVLPCYPPPIQN
jgi:cyclase